MPQAPCDANGKEIRVGDMLYLPVKVIRATLPVLYVQFYYTDPAAATPSFEVYPQVTVIAK